MAEGLETVLSEVGGAAPRQEKQKACGHRDFLTCLPLSGYQEPHTILVILQEGRHLSTTFITNQPSISKKLFSLDSENFLHIPNKSLEKQTQVKEERRESQGHSLGVCLTCAPRSWDFQQPDSERKTSSLPRRKAPWAEPRAGGQAYLAPCLRTQTQSAALWGHCCLGGTGHRNEKAGAGRRRSQVQIPGLQL